MKYFLFFLCFTTNIYGDVNKFKKILFKDVKYLTFYKNVYSTGRRTTPQLQLQRVGGDAPENIELDFAECHQINYGSFGPEWKCKDSHKKDLDVSHFIVSCEGYDNENDEYILDGSCILKYQLGKRTIMKENDNDTLHFWIFILFVIGCIMLTLICGNRNNNRIPNEGIDINSDENDYINRENERYGGRPNTDPFCKRRLINNHSIDDNNTDTNNMEWSCVGQSSNR